MEPKPGIEALYKLADLGYRFNVEGVTIKARYAGPGAPDPEQVAPLIELLRVHKDEVRRYVSQAQAQEERILTCGECPWYRNNPWTHHPELPAWCDWHFDHLVGDNPVCIGYRRGELPSPGSVLFHRQELHGQGAVNKPISAESATPTCGDCDYFLCSSINPLQGFGRCALADVSGRPGAYPGKAACGHFEKRLAETVAKH